MKAWCAATALAAALMTGCETPVIDFSPPVTITSETVGVGRSAKVGDVVTVDYRVMLPDGREVLNSRAFTFELGRGAVIVGIDDAVEGMRPGGKRAFICPPNRHWGRQAYGSIPANTTLDIEVRLTAIQ